MALGLPNLITIFRILLVPIYWIVFLNVEQDKVLICSLIYLVAGVSDFLDGYLARKNDQVTQLGMVLDPLADKLITISVVASFVMSGIIPTWVLYFMAGKEVLMVVVGSILYFSKYNFAIPSNIFGKVATTMFYIYVIALIFRLIDIANILLFVSVGLNVIAFLSYVYTFGKAVKDSDIIRKNS